MPTTHQRLFNRWIQQNYDALQRVMPMRDMLHSAYVTVYEIRRPYLPTSERFRELMDDAYHRHMLREFNHNMHFTIPDPRFWMFADEDEMLQPVYNDAPSRSINDLSMRSTKRLFQFVKKNFPKDVFLIFRMAVAEQKSLSEISKITGKPKPEVRIHLNNIERAIRERVSLSKAKRSDNESIHIS